MPTENFNAFYRNNHCADKCNTLAILWIHSKLGVLDVMHPCIGLITVGSKKSTNLLTSIRNYCDWQLTMWMFFFVGCNLFDLIHWFVRIIVSSSKRSTKIQHNEIELIRIVFIHAHTYTQCHDRNGRNPTSYDASRCNTIDCRCKRKHSNAMTTTTIDLHLHTFYLHLTKFERRSEENHWFLVSQWKMMCICVCVRMYVPVLFLISWCFVMTEITWLSCVV